MFKKLLFTFLLVSVGAFAQQGQSKIPVKFQMSEVFNDSKRFTDLSFSSADSNGGIFIGREHNRGCYVEHYDANAKLLKSHDFKLKNRKSSIEGGFVSGDNFYVIEYIMNRDTKALEYYTNKSPLNKFSFKRELLFSVPVKDLKTFSLSMLGFGDSSADSDVMGSYIISKNKKYIVFTIDIRNKGAETHRIFVYNQDMDKVYETEFTKEVKDRKFQLQNVDVDEADGTVYLLGKSFSDEARKKKDGGRYEYELYRITEAGQESVIFDSEDKYAGSLTTIVNNGKLFCVGFYSEKRDNRFKGVVHFDLDPKTLALNKATYSPFTEQFVIDKYGKEKDKELRHVRFKDILVTENNEVILNAEEYYVTSTYSNTGNVRYRYHFNDMMSSMINADGTLKWARNINKAQVAGYYSPFLSYTSTYHNGKTYLFINGSKKIRKLRNDRLQFKNVSQNKSNLYVITLDSDGNFEYMKLLTKKDSKVPFQVGQGFVTNNGQEVIFQGRKGRKKQIMKLTL